eukprot:CAMPEP_0172588758 /NCGR_PEP_ID=MMETSP1068-20121228/7622_1 /TAXON_ID=35684 /ORGANISM="Pseudopedinella elastica, Strain CCMP716" /LENGTH=699 /DNA_ID=CAMNT_0013384189 /DNA_START=19 /DNA_END=2118 /DNA_ORIENTATION=-
MAEEGENAPLKFEITSPPPSLTSRANIAPNNWKSCAFTGSIGLFLGILLVAVTYPRSETQAEASFGPHSASLPFCCYHALDDFDVCGSCISKRAPLVPCARCSDCGGVFCSGDGDWPSSAIFAKTDSGTIEGVFNSSIQALEFLGVPYSQPPVKERRWQPPKKPLAWNGVLPALSIGPDCIQPGLSAPFTDEDCLRLSIWTERLEPDASLPVLVYLHGGSSLPVSGGAYRGWSAGDGAVSSMARRGPFLTISVNYRLGVAGFLASEALAAFDERGAGLVGNYGLLDVIEALRWIRRNARQFGGDPSKVTVMGHSSGGTIVLALLASPLARGLFHRAISMSGDPTLVNSTTADAIAASHQKPIMKSKCAHFLNSSLSNASSLPALRSCLYSLTAEDLVAMTPEEWDPKSFGFNVFNASVKAPLLLVDGVDAGACERTVSNHIGDHQLSEPVLPCPFATAKWANIPTILGTTREEADLKPADDTRGFTLDEFRSFVTAQVGRFQSGAISEELGDIYTNSSFDPQRKYAEIIGDASMYCPIIEFALRMRQATHVERFGKVDEAKNTGFYVYSTSQTPGSGEYCPLAKIQAFDYCPTGSFQGIDMLMLFRPPYPAYKYTPADFEYSALLLSRFREFMIKGTVDAWDSFSARAINSDIAPSNQIEYRVVDLQTKCNSKSLVMLENFKRDACNLIMSKGFSRALI